MREAGTPGRFDYRYELRDIEAGIESDLETNWGTWVLWYPFDAADTVVDPIYPVGGSATGRAWKQPVRLPVVDINLTQGTTPQNVHEGFYNVDSLNLTVRADALDHLGLGYITDDPDQFVKDRAVYRGQVFTPTSIGPVGLVGPSGYTVVNITLDEVNPDELVNDATFQSYAS